MPNHLISPEGLKRLTEYKYISHTPSLLERALSKWWELAITFVPMSVAPNTITLVGFVAMILSYLPMMCYDLSLTKEIPSWLFILAAFLHFFYQTADAIDGKQARRTKSSSPLGHLFDHGCDSFSTCFFLLSLVQGFQLGENHFTVFIFYSVALFVFWAFSWNQCHTKVLMLSFAGIGITELQYLMMTLLTLTGFLGQSFWLTKTGEFIPSPLRNILPAHPIIQTVLETPFKIGFVYFSLAIMVAAAINLLYSTTSASRSKLSILKQHIPFLHLVILFAIWAQTNFYAQNRALTFVIFGMYYSLITSRLIIHGVTEDPFPLYHTELIALTALTPLLFLRGIFPDVKLPFPEEKAFLIFVSFLTLVSCYSWAAQIMGEISGYLGISCFSINPQKQPGPKPAAEETKKIQ